MADRPAEPQREIVPKRPIHADIAGNRLELLKGDQTSRHSIRINDQYRVTFRWEQGHAHEVRVEDYH